MATNQMSGFIQHLRRVLRDGAGLTDGQLLGDYLSRRDEAAIAALVRRHGPMVWGVCRRVLHNHHDAEDAFQTTFLVLVRKAASIASRELLANWLYGVAHQTALKARATAAKRKGRERQATEMPEPAVTQQDPWRDLQPLLDEELSRLPDKYRSVIVLCDLEGKTRKEAAGQLRCPEGTVAGRLARARIMLAKRLTRRGVALSGGALAAVLSQQAASAAVPASAVVSTIKAATLLAAGKAAATGAISVKVAALTEGVMKAMLVTKLKTVLAVALILGFLATGATVLTCRTAAGQEDKPPLAKKTPPTLSDKPPTKTDDATNVETDEDDFKALQGKWIVTAAENFARSSYGGHALGKAGAAILIKGKEMFVLDKDGKIDPDDLITIKPDFSKKPKWVDFQISPDISSPGIVEVKDNILKFCWNEKGRERPTEFAAPPNSNFVLWVLKRKDDKVGKREMDGFTAWGKEAGGLQAGLGYYPGQHRPYHIGETVALVVRVRNVSKEAVKFQYLRNFFMEKPPTVTDGEGKPVPFQYGVFDLAAAHLPVDVNLAPGKEIELYEWKLELRPASESGKAMLSTLYGTGKFQIQYERVFGNSSAGQIKLDSALSKLVTGKLELEVKPEAAPKDDNKANKAVNPRVSLDKTKATVEGQLDEASTLVLRIGEEKDKLFWEARRKGTPGSAMVRFSEEGAKRFWGDKAQSAGAFKAVVELSDKILMSDGKFATGFIYSVAVSEGAATEKQNLIGSMIYVPIPKTGTLQDFLARSLAGDAMPFGQLALRDESKVVRKDGVVTFADIQKGDGTLVPVSFVIKKPGREDKPTLAEKPVATPAKQELEKKEEDFAWGKEVNGLQLGLALMPADKIAYRPGEVIQFEVRVRNIGKAPITISYGRLNDSRPEISDAQGAKVPVAMPPIAFYFVVPTEKILKPGEAVTLYKPEVAVEEILEGKADATTHVQTPTIRLPRGKYKITFGGMVQSHPALSTGAVEFEVTDKNSKAKDGAGTSLSDAIKALNTKASHDPIGKDETPITEPEVVAAIWAAKRPEDSAVTDKMFDAFKKIAETKQLPPGAELEAIGGPWDPGESFVYDVWWVRLRMPKEANGTYGFAIRERFIRSRTLQEELARLEKERPAEGELPVVDGGRTQERINDLKARIEKMRTK